ncbi:MAG: OmpA family protein [Bacteroidia bacterium]|nr:OmpA family protein [Bacteroidia bacterium]
MLQKLVLLTWVYAYVCVSISALYAQEIRGLKIKSSTSLYLQVTDPDAVTEPYIHFENINKIPKYENERLLRRVINAEKQKNYPELDSLLERYIQKFGIKNFRDDIDYVWKLAQLREMKRDTVTALMYYALALRHHSRYYKQIKVHFDSLRSGRFSDYVDLDYYYAIVEARTKIDSLIPPKGVLLNMGDHINSEFPDYAPYMHPSNSVLIFTSRRGPFDAIAGPDYFQNEDLYYTEVDVVYGGWTYATKFSQEINSRYNEGSACLSPDGKKLYFTRCNSPDGFGVCDIYEATYDNGKWKDVKNLGALVNSNDWDSQPCISPDGNTLFFASNREEGFGRTDIWLSRKQIDGSWGKAENLGPTINSIEDEVTPYFHAIKNTLYFSSMGGVHSNGGYDIFKSRWLNDHWEEPKNLGPLVNTPGDEYYFTVDGKGEKLFYAMAKPEKPKDFDIYSFPMPMGARPDAIVKLSGYLIDSVTQKPVIGIVVVLDLDKGVEIEPKFINHYGYFEFDLINSRKYQIIVLGPDAIQVLDSTDFQNDTTWIAINQSIAEKKSLIFESLEFEERSSDIKSDIEPKIQYIISFLKEHPYYLLNITGHTDSDGDDTFNKELSEKRATNIRDYILTHSTLPSNQITALGMGETRPIFPNDTEEHKAKNRRVEFDLVIDSTLYAAYRAAHGDPLITKDDPLSKKDTLVVMRERDRGTGKSTDTEFEYSKDDPNDPESEELDFSDDTFDNFYDDENYEDYDIESDLFDDPLKKDFFDWDKTDPNEIEDIDPKDEISIPDINIPDTDIDTETEKKHPK